MHGALVVAVCSAMQLDMLNAAYPLLSSVSAWSFHGVVLLSVLLMFLLSQRVVRKCSPNAPISLAPHRCGLGVDSTLGMKLAMLALTSSSYLLYGVHLETMHEAHLPIEDKNTRISCFERCSLNLDSSWMPPEERCFCVAHCCMCTYSARHTRAVRHLDNVQQDVERCVVHLLEQPERL